MFIDPYQNIPDWNVTLVDTGLESLTGKRIKLMEKYLSEETFFITWSGLSNINIDLLSKFHKSHKKTLTITAVRPPRVLESSIKDNEVVVLKKNHNYMRMD